MADDSTALTDVVEELEDASQGTDTVKVGHLIDALDQRGYGAALAVLPLMELTPLGGIPGFADAVGFHRHRHCGFCRGDPASWRLILARALSSP